MPKTSEIASVAPTAANLKRSINMKWFTEGHGAVKEEIALAQAQNKPKAEQEKVLGQIVGVIGQVTENTFEGKDGTVQSVLVAQGEFEAINYATGESIESPAANLPRYYLEGVRAQLQQGAVVLVAVEIVLVATGKSIPIAYEVRNLIQRKADSPINRIKAELKNAGRLRLSAPAEVKPEASGELSGVQAPEPPAKA